MAAVHSSRNMGLMRGERSPFMPPRQNPNTASLLGRFGLSIVLCLVSAVLSSGVAFMLWWYRRGAPNGVFVAGNGIPVRLGKLRPTQTADFIIWFDQGYYEAEGVQRACGQLPGPTYLRPGQDSSGLPECMVRTTGLRIVKYLLKHQVKANNKLGVIYIEADSALAQNAPIPSTQKLSQGKMRWGLDRVDVRPLGFDLQYHMPHSGGEGVHIYILDTGVRTTHEDFDGRAIPTLETIDGQVRVCNPQDVNCALDRVGHGTHVAGLAAGKLSGIAKKATIHAVKTIGDDQRLQLSWAVKAIEWVVVNGQRPAVISMSLDSDPDSWTSYSLDQAVQAAYRKGLPVVVASGNAKDAGAEGFDACTVSPAREPSTITVGFSTMADSRGTESNYGSCVDIFAPGKDILSASCHSDTSFVQMTGSSMATPMVSGAVAIGLSQGVAAKTIKSWLLERATPNVLHDVGDGSPNRLLYVAPPVHHHN